MKSSTIRAIAQATLIVIGVILMMSCAAEPVAAISLNPTSDILVHTILLALALLAFYAADRIKP